MYEKNSVESPNKLVEKVAIIGAGLGGLAAALALRKQGINVQIYEKARAFRPVGAGLSLFPNGLNSLDALAPGIAESLKSAGSECRVVNVKQSSGEIVMQNPVSLAEKYGQPMLNIRWSRLQEILASTVPSDIINLDCLCTNFEQNENCVNVYFDNGKTEQVDLLIGADGVNSTVRQILIQDGSPRYAGRLSWRAIIQYKHEALLNNEVTILASKVGKIFTFIDVGEGYIFWSAGALTADCTLSQTAIDVKARVLEEFAGWTEPIQSIVEATNAKDILERPIWDRPPLPSWSNNRVTLLGDAAHPMVPSLGQGANTAFEDAYELAECLSRAANIKAALSSYEQSRIERTQVIQARSGLEGSRSYDTDSDKFLSRATEQSLVSQTEFDDWLYNYKCLAF
jgi:salicylate hydroxylase